MSLSSESSIKESLDSPLPGDEPKSFASPMVIICHDIGAVQGPLCVAMMVPIAHHLLRKTGKREIRIQRLNSGYRSVFWLVAPDSDLVSVKILDSEKVAICCVLFTNRHQPSAL